MKTQWEMNFDEVLRDLLLDKETTTRGHEPIPHMLTREQHELLYRECSPTVH